MLMSVEANSPAAQGTLLQGDVVVTLDGQPVRHVDELQTLLSGERVGKTVPVRIVRGGQVHDLTVTVGQG
jgi:S1-C subfamily serine protease